jgi:hypothetical protein
MTDGYPALEGHDLPEPVVDALENLYQPALEALEASVKATAERRVDVECPECKCKFRKRIKLPDTKLRFEAAKWLHEMRSGRAAIKPSTEAGQIKTMVMFRNVIQSDEAPAEELLRDLAECVVLDSYEMEPGRAKALAGRVYKSLGNFKSDGSATRVPDEWDESTTNGVSRA